MARSFSVYHLEDRDFVREHPPDVHSQAFESWAVECRRRRLCDGDLGDENSIRVFWSEPAIQLGLPLVASIYEDGFWQACDWSGSQLDELGAELDVLTRHWQGKPLDPEQRQRLTERADLLRKGIEIAKHTQAFLLIA